ncbi:uncharacterized protein SETTUDRAFT_28149 [Exserohilum turcica Et28A]|uniref:Uncharacterized protein n=1 Tax=Exserohilum turcicum (strain 28A) TaxID=671987 RepID=R0KHH9_EXST2|nr:uncharacterized protein SETTUDRAFT_28149 [Exserohilum turcica Et28A]EOA87512.1 hypothetical protein SETTUDRAFT_28149 [Exserohilum turcica Et28A]
MPHASNMAKRTRNKFTRQYHPSMAGTSYTGTYCAVQTQHNSSKFYSKTPK